MLLPALVLGGFGMAMTMTPSSAAAMRAVPVEKAGVGSAVLNACRQVGGSTGIALMGAIMASRLDVTPDDGVVHATVSSLRWSWARVIALAGAIVAASLIRPHDPSRKAPSRTGRPEAA